MARITATDGPQEGDLVVATVTTVKQNGCYVSLDEFDDREGFIFIGEIASGWVRNIRAHVREGQRLMKRFLQAFRKCRQASPQFFSITHCSGCWC